MHTGGHFSASLYKFALGVECRFRGYKVVKRQNFTFGGGVLRSMDQAEEIFT